MSSLNQGLIRTISGGVRNRRSGPGPEVPTPLVTYSSTSPFRWKPWISAISRLFRSWKGALVTWPPWVWPLSIRFTPFLAARPDHKGEWESRIVAPGGLLILSTINRTPKARALAITGAELCLKYADRMKSDTDVYFEYSPESFTGTELEFAVGDPRAASPESLP